MSEVELEPGRIIAGKYRVEAALARGGMGSVWRARHLTLDTALAIKFIGPNVTRHVEARKRFEREAKAAALLKSPHVVQIHDYGVEGDLPYLVMELLEGEDLGERLKRKGRLAPEEVVSIVNQVARALRRAAEAGIVHRDLKPSNVFITRGDEEEVVKVLDFGIAKAPRLRTDDDRTRTGAVLGSPRYMSPEQARGTRLVDPRSDLWSLAVIAYRALTGQLPFQSTDIADLLVKICSEDARPPSAIDPSLGPEMDAFFGRALARNPDERFQTARELAVAFASAAGQPAPTTSRLSAVPPLPARSPATPDSGRKSPPPAAPREAEAGPSAAERSTKPESRAAPRASLTPSPISMADCEPTLLSERTGAPPAPRRPLAESTTAPEPTPPPPSLPPMLPPVPRRRFAESTTAPEPTPPPLPPAPAPADRQCVDDPSMTPDSTTSLHVVSTPELLPERTPTSSGGSVVVASRHDAPRRSLGRFLAVGAVILVSLGVALRVGLWMGTDATVTAADGSAPAPPPPLLSSPPPAEPTPPEPEPTASATAAPAPPSPTAARPKRGPAPFAPPSTKKHSILGI